MGSTKLRMQNSSLQFSDTHKQQKHDVRLLFSEGQQYPIKTGSEAGLDRTGGSMNRHYLMQFADEYNHVLHFARDNWVAVDRAIVVPGSVEKGSVFVVDGDKTKGRGHDSVMATLGFTHINPLVGRIHQGAVHYPTQGRTPRDPNWEWNELYAERIGGWMQDEARDKDLAFVNGDFNMPDRKSDWAFGEHFTSMADELKAWEGTGHGDIDGFCSYDKDGRVTATRFAVLNDQEQFMFTDHYVCQGVWDIRHLKI